MSCSGFEKISTKTELLILIYELLPFGDQLRLSRVNEQLKSVFVRFIHPQSYRGLNILETPSADFFVTSERNTNRLLITKEELKEFVNVYGENIEELTEDMGLSFYDDGNPKRTPQVCLEQFHKLKRLQYVSLLIQDEHIQMIAANCPHLRELHFIRCTADEDDDDESLMIGNGLSTKTLQQMQQLKCLVVDSTCIDEHFKYSLFRDLVANLNLECLKLCAILVPDVDVRETETDIDYVQHQLKELEIFTSFHPEKWGNKFLSFLRIFENLSILSLRIPDKVTNSVLEIIAKACKNLETFNIGAYTKFQDIKQFSMPPKVTEFSLRNCYGLTHHNLKEILTAFRIQKFVSHSVLYMGEFQDFQISPFIQVLDLADIDTYKFPSAYVNNDNLKELHWYEDENEDNVDFMPRCHVGGTFETCINLETLNITSGFLPVNAILQLSHLQKLKIPQSMPHLNWSYVTALLKHPPLKELAIQSSWSDKGDANCLINSSDLPIEGFTTNVKIVNINFVIFERAFDFWLDVLNQNSEIKLVCDAFDIDGEFLKKLIGHQKFPKHLRTIDIWGFKIYCRDLRNNFKITMDKLYQATSRSPPEYVFYEKIANLVLQKV